LTQRIVGDSGRWYAEGVEINQVGTDIVRGVVVIRSDDPDRVRPQIIERYGNGWPSSE
jgi:hypothetical protein